MHSCNNKKCTNNYKKECCPSGPPGAVGEAGVPSLSLRGMETTTAPVETLMHPAELAQIFIELAKTGVKKLDFAVPALQDLSFQLVQLVAENRHLRKLLKLGEGDDINVRVTADAIRVFFGPGGSYQLSIPVDVSKAVFAQRLRAVADALEAGTTDPQLMLFED